MTRKVANSRVSTKSTKSRMRNQKRRIRNPFPPVMDKMKELLKGRNVSHELHYLTSEPQSSLQKMLSGNRPVNPAVLLGLLRSDHGREVLFTLMGDARPDWFVKYAKQLDINSARRQLIDSQRAIEAFQAEIV